MRSVARALVLLLPLALGAPSALAAPPVVDVRGVPARLELPLPPGTNRMLDIRVTGGRPGAVWLAAAEGATRVPAARSAKGWALNLGDPALIDALAGADRFQIYAEMANGAVVASVPVLFVRRRPAAHEVRWALTVAGEPRPLEVGEQPWVVPARVERLFAEHDGPAPEVVARAGGESWRFAPSEARGRVVLVPTPDLRARWSRAGVLHLEVDGQPSRSLRAVPGRLESAAVELTVKQRRSAEIPGSAGYLRMDLGDITAGQVLVSMHTADDGELVPQRSMQPGESMPFELSESRYALHLDRLVNLLAGEDYAVFRVAPAAARDEAARIRALLQAIEASDARFLRGGAEHDGKAAAEHLRRKLEAAPPGSVATLEAFIDRIGSRSTLTGEVYRVRTPDGRERPAAEWLRELARGR